MIWAILSIVSLLGLVGSVTLNLVFYVRIERMKERAAMVSETRDRRPQ